MIYVVAGIGTGNAEKTAYDAALKDAGLHNQNIVQLSSVIPEAEEVSTIGKIPSDRYNVGNIVPVVESKSVISEGKSTVGLAWANSPKGGVIMEGTSSDTEEDLREKVEELKRDRNWEFSETEVCTETIHGNIGDKYTAAVVCAVYPAISLKDG